MIAFSTYYHFSAEDVESIEETSGEHEDYPYKLTVYLRSGKLYSVSYKYCESRDKARDEIVRQVECQKRADSEKILNSLYLIRSELSRIDRRELRIWRQLRDLLEVRVEEN